jgi:hypothetical protein
MESPHTWPASGRCESDRFDVLDRFGHAIASVDAIALGALDLDALDR